VDIGKFKQILLQVFLLPVFAVLLMVLALYIDITSNSRTVGQIVQYDSRIAQTTLVYKLILDEESSLRGYQTTGDARFLDPYYTADPLIAKELSNLEYMASASQSEVDHIRHLREQHLTWHDGFATPVIASLRSGGNADDVNLNLQGKTLMDAIRADLDAIIADAQDHRVELIRLRQKNRRELLAGMFLMAIAVGLAIGIFTRNRLHAVADAYRDSLDATKRRADELFDSEQELRTTLASIGDGVITCDASGCIQMMNPVAQTLTGWSFQEAEGRPLEDVFHIFHEVTRDVVENPVSKVKRHGGIVGLANHTVLVRRDGTEISIADSGAPILGKTGETIGTVLVFRDVTMERRTQDALVANEKLAVAGRLAATIAHEIHNPLDSVSNLLYLMRTGNDAEESRQFMVTAEQELARVTQISRAMLGLYREAKVPVNIDLREMLGEILLLMHHRIIDLGVTVHADMPDTIIVDGFPAELRQVFSNLITNAAEATGRGGQIWVTVSTEPAGTNSHGKRSEPGATVRVRDNGPGIEEDIRPQLFQPFFTTKGENGTGLGLWVSRGIVSKHGGSITIESDQTEQAHGTIVSVFLATKPVMQPGAD
jgi:PAS domain S-box-containing protein